MKLPRNPTDTQLDAAKRIWPRAETQRGRVLRLITWTPSTDEEIAGWCRMNLNSVRPRRKELQEAGWIRDSGLRRKTRSGVKAIVWEYVP